MLGFSKHSRLFFVISLSVFIVAVALATWAIPLIVRKQIQKNVQLDNSSQTFEKWRKIPMPLTFRVHIFNVTNPDEVTNGEKPLLAEVGPYVYEEYRERTILGYGENDTIEYMLQKRFYFDSTASGTFTEDDEVTVINFSYMAALLSVAELMPGLVPMVNDALGDFFPDLNDPFLRVKVKDLLFDGIYLNCASNKSALGLVCGKIKADTPSTMRLADEGNGFWFSMFSHLNRTPTGPYAMVRGTQNIRELGHIVSYKGKQKMSQWGDKYCGQMNGSDSSIFPPVDESNVPDKLYIFEPEICRSLYASLVGKSSLFNMSAYYYELAESALAAKSANPNNKCFCRRNWSANHDGCLLMGLLNLQPCQGAPAIASLPHFYLGSEELLEFFAGGISPDPEKHKTFVYLEPKTGVVLKGLQRLQFNIELRNMPQVPQLEKVPTGLFPLLWIEEGATLPDSIVEELRYSHRLLSYVDTFRWAFLACSFLLLAISIIIVVRSGTIPIFPKSSNTVSFVLRPGNFHPTDKVQ